MRELRDIMFQCNPCVMCKNNVFHCGLSDTCTCNAENNWKKLVEHLNLMENDNKSMRQELEAYYDKNNAIVVDDLIQRLTDKAYAFIIELHTAPFRKSYIIQLCTEPSKNVISFSDAELIGALQKAVAYLEGEEK